MQSIRAPFALAHGQRIIHRKWLHVSSSRLAISKFAMPAMSPTMTEGGIAQWKKKEGESFSAGDVLLEIETDKATIDVEAQDDGVLGKILSPDGSKNVPIGKTIALLAEEGDDISNIEAPAEEYSELPNQKQEPSPDSLRKEAPVASPSSSNQSAHEVHIKHSKPLFPSVQRLLSENALENADVIKGTGVRGMLTKGDVLAYLGKISTPLGSFKPPKSIFPEQDARTPQAQKQLDGLELRRLISSNMLQNSLRARSIPPPSTPYDFDSIIADYLPPRNKSGELNEGVSQKDATPQAPTSYFDGLI